MPTVTMPAVFTQNLKSLRSSGYPYENVKISWTSDHPEIIDPSSKTVNRPANADAVDVKLTATITYGTASDTKEHNLTVRWTETSSITTFTEFTNALSRPMVQTIILKGGLTGAGTYDGNNKTLIADFNGTNMFYVDSSLNLGNLTINGNNNASTITRAAYLGNSKNINLDNITFQGTDGFDYLIWGGDIGTGQYEIVATNCHFSPVKKYALDAVTSSSLKGTPGYGKKITLTGNTFASGANIKIEAGIATLNDNTINSRIEVLKGVTLNGIVITDAATAQTAVDVLLAANQITAPADGSYGITIYDTDGTTVLYETLKIEQPKPALVVVSTDATGSKITVSFDMAMADPSGQQGQFTVLVNGNANQVTGAALNTDLKKVDLTLAIPVVYGDAIKISYTPGTVASADGVLLESFTGIDVVNNLPASVVEKPIATPSSGEVDDNTAVTLVTGTAGASIYYTIDGATPTSSSTLYENPIVINEAKTIKAIAVKEGMQDSNVLTAAYTVKSIDDTSVNAYLCEINSDNTSTTGTLIVSGTTVPINPIIKLKFANNVVYNAAQNISCVSLMSSSGQEVNANIFTLGTGGGTNPEKANIFVQPQTALAFSAAYKIVISPEVTFKNGSKLGEPAVEINFTTVDQSAEVTLSKATISGAELTLSGLPFEANLEYHIVTGSDSSAWTTLTYTGTSATLDSSTLNLVSGVSQVEVRVQDGSGATASKTVFIAIDGNKTEMQNNDPLCFEDNVTIIPENMDIAGINEVSIKRTTMPSEMNIRMIPVGFAYEIYFQGSGEDNKATLSLPVDPSLNINQMSVYTIDKSNDTTADKSNPLYWRIKYLEPDRSQADKHVISVTATDVPETGGTFVYQVFCDNCLPGPVGFTSPPIVDIENHKITFPQIQAYDNDQLSKIEVYRDNSMIDSIDMKDFEGAFIDVNPAFQVGQMYAYNLKAYDRMGNWSWCTNIGPGWGEPMQPSGDVKVLFEDDASLVEKVKQQLLDGTLPITFAPGDSFDHVVTDFTLPNPHDSWPYVWITWSSSDPDIIRPIDYNAIVVKPADGNDKEVTLTATIARQDGTTAPITTTTASWKIKVSWEPWEGGVIPVRTQDSNNGVRDTMYEFWTALDKDNIQKIIMLSPFADSFPDNTLDLKGKTLVFENCVFNSANYGNGVNAIIENGTIDASGIPYEAVALAQQNSGFIFDNVEFIGGENLDSYILFRGGSLVLNNCRFGSTKVAPVSIQQSIIENYNQPSGIRIENCTFDGAGKPGYAVLYEKDGILTAVNNTMTGFQGNTSSGSPSAGFLIPSGRTATLVGNKISNCDNDILVQTRSSSNSKVNDVQIDNKDAAELAGIALLESNELTPGSGPVVVIENVDSLFHPVVWYQADKDELSSPIGAPTWTDGSMTASEIDESELTLSWNGADDTVAVTSYKVYQGANLIATILGNDTTYHVTDLLPGTKYQFRVEAGNAAGKWSLDGPTVDAITLANTAPIWSEDSQVNVIEIGPNSVILSWTPATDEQGISLYDVYVDGQGTEHWTKASNPSIAVVYVDAVNLQPDTEYNFHIYAEDTCKARSSGPSVKVKTSTGTPTNWTLGNQRFMASNIQSTSLTLNWVSATIIDPPTENAQFKLFCNGQELGTTTYDKRSYDVTGLQPDSEYTFKLEVSEDGTWSTDGPSITVTTLAQGSNNGQIGQPVDIYLQGSTSWLNSICDVKIGGDYGHDGISVFDKCTVTPGHIIIGAGAFAEPGDYDILIRATGYPDVFVTQTMASSSGISDPTIGGDGSDDGSGDGSGEGTGAPGELIVDITAQETSANNTVLWLDFNKGIANYPACMSKIKVYKKSNSSSIGYNHEYKKIGSGDDAVKIRRLILSFDNLEAGATYVVKIQPDFASNNGSTLGETVKWEFTTEAAGAPGGSLISGVEPVVVTEPVPVLAPGVISLTDITGHWAQAAIEQLVGSGAINGYLDDTFKPDNTITRAEFAAMLVRAFNLEPKDGKVFNDTADHWAKDYIATTQAYGIINGYDDLTFGPDDVLTREQMAVMIVKAAQLNPPAAASIFTDADQISEWAKEAVYTSTENGVMNGYPDGTFRPQVNASRAEAVTVIVNALQ